MKYSFKNVIDMHDLWLVWQPIAAQSASCDMENQNKNMLFCEVWYILCPALQ